MKFEVKEEHIKLLRRMYVGWDDGEFGAPAIDCKRPYGNSNVYSDMGKILDIAPALGEDGFSDAQEKAFDALHKETQTALQIFIATGEMKAGVYVADTYSINWRAYD